MTTDHTGRPVLDLDAIRARWHALQTEVVVDTSDRWDLLLTVQKAGRTALESARDVPDLLAEVERLREDLAAQREIADANRDAAFANHRASFPPTDTADAQRLAQDLRDIAAADPRLPIAVRAAAGWLVDLARERDEAREEAQTWRESAIGFDREATELRQQVHDLLNPTGATGTTKGAFTITAPTGEGADHA